MNTRIFPAYGSGISGPLIGKITTDLTKLNRKLKGSSINFMSKANSTTKKTPEEIADELVVKFLGNRTRYQWLDPDGRVWCLDEAFSQALREYGTQCFERAAEITGQLGERTSERRIRAEAKKLRSGK